MMRNLSSVMLDDAKLFYSREFYSREYSYFEKGCRKKKTSKVHATRPKGGLGIHWNFAYWPRGNLQVCIFARGGFVFPLRRPLSVALLLLSHVFE